MRAYASGTQPGWAVGLQGLSDTLGGAAEFEQGKRQSDAVLAQRQREEERRQQQFQLDLQQAQRQVERENAVQGLSFAQAQQELSRQQQDIFAQMMGGPPTVDQDQELGRIQAIAGKLKPENADIFLKEIRTDRARQAATNGLSQLSQELVRPISEGTVQDEQAQQQLGLVQQALMQLGQQVQAGTISPDQVPRFVDQAVEHQQSILKDYAKRQADLQTRQATVQQIEMHKQGLMAGDPRLARLNEMQQLSSLGMMSPQAVGAKLIQDQFGISDEEMQAFEEVKAAKQAALSRQALTDPTGAIGSFARELGMTSQKPQVSGERQKFVEALKRLKNPTPEQIRMLGKRYGIQDLSPEEEEALFGG